VCLALGLKDRVTFVGEADRTRVRELLAGCELLVLSSWSEGLPIVALEAMASGKAVIGTEVGGIPEIVADGDTGLLVPPGDTDALSKAILRLLDDPEARGAMGRSGLARVKTRYDFPQTVDRYLEAYGEKLPPAGITA
jgi:glycosyltransferase involved in cell wall biosynthesis